MTTFVAAAVFIGLPWAIGGIIGWRLGKHERTGLTLEESTRATISPRYPDLLPVRHADVAGAH